MKSILLLILAISLSACRPSPPSESEVKLTLISPRGAPAFALIPLLNQGLDAIEFVDGADVLSAELLKGEADLVVAPINLGAQLAQRGDFPYRVYAILTWGNLYVVAREDAAMDAELALFGRESVPGLLFRTLVSERYASANLQGYSSVNEVLAQLLAGQVQRALLAEPSLSIAQMRAREQGWTLSVEEDFQARWREFSQSHNYPQAALFVRADLPEATLCVVAERFEVMQAFISGLSGNSASLQESLRTLNLSDLGLPDIHVLAQVWTRMSVDPRLAIDEKSSIEAFLELFGWAGLENFYLQGDSLD
jgi:NitT/TauT family transport system substrate-binding protein